MQKEKRDNSQVILVVVNQERYAVMLMSSYN
jgi:hypothetical protein